MLACQLTSRFSHTCPLFQVSEYFNVPKMFGFLVFVESHTHIFGGRYVRYSLQFQQATFQLQNLFSLTSGGSERMIAQPVSGRSFPIVSSTVEDVLRAVQFVCPFIAVLQWGKETLNSGMKCKTSIRVSEMFATSGKPNAQYVNQELSCLWRTRVVFVFELTWNASRTRKLQRLNKFSKSNKILLHQEANQMMLFQRQNVRFHFIPCNIIVFIRKRTTILFYSKQYFQIS